MLLLDASLRFPAITLLLVSAVFCLRDAPRLLQSRLCTALCVSLAGMLIHSMPAIYGLSPILDTIAWAVHVPNVVFVWLFGLSLLKDDFQLTRFHWAVLAVVAINLSVVKIQMLAGDVSVLHPALLANRLTTFAILTHLLWAAVSGWRDDLIEARRRTRLILTVGTAVAATFVISAETVQALRTGSTEDPAWFSTMRAGVIFPLTLFGALWFLHIQRQNFLFEPVLRPVVKPPTVDPRDTAIHARLTQAMEKDKLYRQHGLSIGTLAEKVRAPEHQLRALINQGLGYRNFSAFLKHRHFKLNQ